jgi:hypothetical protein
VANAEGMEGKMAQCIEHCLACSKTCFETLNFCIDQGGKHVESAHLHLMMNCKKICQLAAQFMLSKSRYHARLCGLCAEICRDCERECAKFSEPPMKACADACRRCADSCETMAAA